jgi:carbamoyltransferase
LIVLGINAFHADAAAAILRDGLLVGAVEEERFTRVKHWAGFPAQSIAWCLEKAGATLGDIDLIAINQDSRASLWPRLRYLAAHPPRIGLWQSRLRTRAARISAAAHLAKAFPGERFRGTWQRVEHHMAHMASAYLVSPFRAAAVVSVDGMGDFASAAWGRGEGDAMTIDGRIAFPHSLGIFYQALTQYLGFEAYGDEYKVMGLAPYGQPRHAGALRHVLSSGGDGRFALDLSYFRHHSAAIAGHWRSGAPVFSTLFSDKLEALLGPRRGADEELSQRHRDIAASTQAVYEDAFFNLLNAVQKTSGMTQLALAGGCAMNSVANGRIAQRTGFREVYVPPAPGDAGGAIGAALVARQRAGGKRVFAMDHAAWGPAFGADDIARAIADCAAALRAAGCAIAPLNDVEAACKRAAQAIADGKVVGWFYGAAEWGPRALGQRSILADPRRADMKDILNVRIKRRESFRPFAPAVLEEAVADWFGHAGEGPIKAPFMSQVLPVKSDKRGLIPAVTHVDGSARMQTVSRQSNPRFWQLIDAFRAITGVPMLLNTSFNENEPIVLTPREALDCFLRASLDVLVLGDTFIAGPGG